MWGIQENVCLWDCDMRLCVVTMTKCCDCTSLYKNFHTFILKRNMQGVCFGELSSGRECSMSISQVRQERALQVYFLWDYCIPVSLHPYCCSEGTALAPQPRTCLTYLWTTYNWRTTGAPLCHFYTHYEYWLKAKTVWSRTEGEQLLSDTVYKSFGQGLNAAIIYAGFFKKSLLWCAGTSSLKGRKHELLLLRSLKNAQ